MDENGALKKRPALIGNFSCYCQAIPDSAGDLEHLAECLIAAAVVVSTAADSIAAAA
jgi:hypothetical protein